MHVSGGLETLVTLLIERTHSICLVLKKNWVDSDNISMGTIQLKVIRGFKKWKYAPVEVARIAINLVFDQENLVSGFLRCRQSISMHKKCLS